MEGSKSATGDGSKTWANNSRVRLFLSQQHRDFHEDLVWVGTTRSNQRMIPRRSNMKNSLITMSFKLVYPWIGRQNNCIYSGKHNALADTLNNQCCPTITTQSTSISISANKRWLSLLPITFLFLVLALFSSWFIFLFSYSHINSPCFAPPIPLGPFSSAPLWLCGHLKRNHNPNTKCHTHRNPHSWTARAFVLVGSSKTCVLCLLIIWVQSRKKNSGLQPKRPSW